MADVVVSRILESTWREQRVWSLAANGLRRRITRWQTVILLLAIVGAVLVTLGAQVAETASGTGRGLSGLGAALLALSPVISKTKLGKDTITDWNRARSVSEGLKSEVYLYRSGADPYGDEDRDGALINRTKEILDGVGELSLHVALVEPDNKPVPPRMDVDEYIELRVNAQIDDYYVPRATLITKRLGWLRNIEFVLALAAAGLAIVATAAIVGSAASGLAPWVAVVTTAGAAVTAHIAATRYEYLAATYMSTARRLRFLRDEWLAQRDDRMSRSEFVHACENAISVENQAWMAKWAATNDQ